MRARDRRSFRRQDRPSTCAGAAAVTVATQGPWKNLAIDLTAELPALKIDEQDIVPSTLTANLVLSRSPRELRGPVRILFADAAQTASKSRIDGDFVWDRKSTIRLEYLSAFYRSARISGMIDLDTGKEAVDARLAFDIPELSGLPLPVRARGALLGAAGIVHDGSTRIDAEIASRAVEIEGVAIEGLAASSTGTQAGFSATLNAKSIVLSGVRANDVALAGNVVREEGKTRLALNRLKATVGKKSVTLNAPAVITIDGGEIALADTQVRWGEGALRAQGAMGTDIALDLRADSVDLPFAPYLASGVIHIDTSRAEAGTIALTLTPSTDNNINLRAEIAGRWANDRLALEGAIAGYGHDAAFGRIEPARISLPLVLIRHGDAFTIGTAGAIDGRIAYKGNIDRFVPLFPLSEQTITGDADIDIAISGTLAKPQFAGRAGVTGGTYEHTGVGIYLDRVNVSAEGSAFGGRELVIRGTASDRRGGAGTPIRIDGLVGFQPQPKIAATLKLDHARVLNTANVTADVSGALKLEGALAGAALSGYVDINTAEFRIPKSLPPDIVAVKVVDRAKAEAVPGKPVALAREAPVDFPMDVRVSARQQIYVRGRGLDSEWAANLRAMGTVRDPHVDGTMTLRRGRFDFSGRQFTLSSGLVTFVPSRTSDPDLALEARNQMASGTTAVISVSGRASKPVIRLSSDPPLPQDDVMALVLFGRPAERLSALQAVQVANAIATLTGTSPLGGGGTGLLDRARASLGLDLLDVSVGGEGGSSVTVGKYLRRGVFVSASPGIGDKPGSVSAQIELSKSVSVETKIGQDAQESVGINWKHDY
ncbi:MAG: translocation/assembly module TamB domain-containing protein [Alphaproteobacteria bacterium]